MQAAPRPGSTDVPLGWSFYADCCHVVAQRERPSRDLDDEIRGRFHGYSAGAIAEVTAWRDGHPAYGAGGVPGAIPVPFRMHRTVGCIHRASAAATPPAVPPRGRLRSEGVVSTSVR
ncbi:DUF6302 family protein [Streptomyces clavuligerus]|uniref:DUF6302 family protein n=1 Tax=Streptomyces clavuligerus TaxID=1901 RepID=UPI00017FF639|nr:hypothetical protein SSCG_02264 [Streptomyces clavuligerus]WDN56145.1 hypothetical protein LL058_30265 [Streptomyces clavuligerus]